MTMKLEIYNAPTAVPTAPVLLQLKAVSDGIELVVVQSNGVICPSGRLCKLCNDGTIYMNRGVNSIFGFNRNDVGQIKSVR